MKTRAAFAGALLAVVTGAAFLLAKGGAPHRPRYIFINETTDHRHDLALKMSLKLAESRSGIENALVLLRELPPGATLESHAEALFRRWEIGRSRGGRGILYLYAERENRFRIEVAYSLEGVYPDALCRRMEEAAKTYLLSEVPQDFLSELLITMNLHGGEEKENIEDWLVPGPLSGGGGAQTVGFRRTPEELFTAIRRLPAMAEDDYSASTDPKETLNRYLHSLAMGVGAPQLPLLTSGSEVFRAVAPRTPAQLNRMAREYAHPYRFVSATDFALAVFEVKATLPIVLRHARDGRWFVDEPKAWTWFHRFESSDRFVPRFDDLPIAPLLRELKNVAAPIHEKHVPTPRPPAYPYSLEKVLATTRDPLTQGDLYRFETNWLSRAIEAYERAARLDPNDPRPHWRLWDAYVDDSQMEKALAELDTLARLLPNDSTVQDWRKYYRAQYAEVEREAALNQH